MDRGEEGVEERAPSAKLEEERRVSSAYFHILHTNSINHSILKNGESMMVQGVSEGQFY